jgi:CheY-like chemotaxis protein
MTFSKIRTEFSSQDLQFIAINSLGTIIESDNKLVDLKPDTSLNDFHPFFEILPSCFESEKKHNRFECVHLNDRIYDIDIINNSFDKGIIILREGTEFYNRLQEIAQKRNESIIFNEVLEFKNDILKEQEEFKDKFIGNFSHELRNPLTLVTAFSSMLLKTDLNVDQEALVESIISQSNRIQEIIDDIVALSILKRQSVSLEQKQFDFHNLLEDVQVNHISRAKAKGTRLTIHCAPTIPKILTGDERRISQVITNLLEHVLQFSEGDDIKLEILDNQRRANKISLSIQLQSKTGTVPEQFKNRKKDSLIEHSTVNSSNLGLSITEELLVLMDGSLTSTIDGDGTSNIIAKLKLIVPLHINDVQTESKKATDNIVLSQKINVIIAEDYGVAQLTAVKVLVSSGNFTTEVYSNPKDLLEAIQNKEYDVILMASSISQIDAIELLGMVREFGNNKNKKIPAIALSTKSKPEELKEYSKAGFKDVIKKPYTDDEVLSTIYKRLNLKKFK